MDPELTIVSGSGRSNARHRELRQAGTAADSAQSQSHILPRRSSTAPAQAMPIAFMQRRIAIPMGSSRSARFCRSPHPRTAFMPPDSAIRHCCRIAHRRDLATQDGGAIERVFETELLGSMVRRKVPGSQTTAAFRPGTWPECTVRFGSCLCAESHPALPEAIRGMGSVKCHGHATKGSGDAWFRQGDTGSSRRPSPIVCARWRTSRHVVDLGRGCVYVAFGDRCSSHVAASS